ncbi:helix-turn-helix domain-containing protein [Sphaerisporangium sp. NPDC005288]|uniref:ArsR/SmtB family transcription factor n=1 Tax=Sphaerisporangium sp. NPDC005288 TaxID=3155114 RepID=UPI0033BAF903
MTRTVENRIDAGPDIAAVAGLLGDRTRATMVKALVADRAMPASELAALSGVSRPTASEHLARLVEHGIISVERCGRHAYYRLAGPEVATALEALAVLAPIHPPRSLRSSFHLDNLRRARTCYDHVAGRLGVAIADVLQSRGLVRRTGDGLELDVPVWQDLRPLDIDCRPSLKGRRPAIRACVDWSERRHHVAGALAGAITHRLFELGWIVRPRDGERVVKVTDEGFDGLARSFGLPASVLRTDSADEERGAASS